MLFRTLVAILSLSAGILMPLHAHVRAEAGHTSGLDFLIGGWNLRAVDPGTSPAEIQDEFPCVSSIWAFNGQWYAWFDGQPSWVPNSIKTDATLTPKLGYWIYCDAGR